MNIFWYKSLMQKKPAVHYQSISATGILVPMFLHSVSPPQVPPPLRKPKRNYQRSWGNLVAGKVTPVEMARHELITAAWSKAIEHDEYLMYLGRPCWGMKTCCVLRICGCQYWVFLMISYLNWWVYDSIDVSVLIKWKRWISMLHWWFADDNLRSFCMDTDRLCRYIGIKAIQSC